MTGTRQLMLVDLLLENVLLSDGQVSDIGIHNGKISHIGKMPCKAQHLLDCSGLIALPSLVNAHTHSAMTLFRGWGDDLPLHEWLTKKIWPAEAHMTSDDVFNGAMLACLEMISSGTTFFNDMYWHPRATLRAARATGLKAWICGVFIDGFDNSRTEPQWSEAMSLYEEIGDDSRIKFVLGPHAPYSVSKALLVRCAEFAKKHDIPIHIHLNETEREVHEFEARHGIRPIEWLADIGFLDEHVFAAHCIWLSDREFELLASHGCTVLHLPTSNLKLASGEKFLINRFREAGVRVLLGTDGCASNNNLDMFEEMKFSALQQKSRTANPLEVSAVQMLDMATRDGANAFHTGGGSLETGFSADIMLLDSNTPALVPMHEIASNLVYSANGSCVSGVLCDGNAIMWNRHIEGASDIIGKARETAARLCSRWAFGTPAT